MNKEQILQYNKRCAEFLGWKIDFDEILSVPDTCKVKPQIYWPAYQNLLFHSDWNWIMEVVEAIEKIEIKEAQKENPIIELNRQLGKVLDLPIYTKKEAVVEVINNFLIWYNDNANK